MKFSSYVDMGSTRRWYAFVYYKETGQKQAIRVGRGKLWFGSTDPGLVGQRSLARFQVDDEVGPIELFPGAQVYAVVAAPTPEENLQYSAFVNEQDLVELVRATDVVAVEDFGLMRDLAKLDDAVAKQLGPRKRMI